MVQFVPKVAIISQKSISGGMPGGIARSMSQSSQEHTQIENISPVGILTGVVFCLIFSYAYFTAARTGKLTFNLKDHYGITLSEAMQHSEKIGTTILIVIYAGLYLGLMIDKGFLVDNDEVKTSLVGTNYALLLGMLLLFLVPPSKNSIQEGVHFLIAALIICFTVYSNFIISEVYRSEYEENDYTKSLLGLGSVSLICGIFIIGIITVKFAFGVNRGGYIYKSMFTAVGVLELVIVLAYCVATFLFSVMPKLPSYDCKEVLQVCMVE